MTGHSHRWTGSSHTHLADVDSHRPREKSWSCGNVIKSPDTSSGILLRAQGSGFIVSSFLESVEAQEAQMRALPYKSQLRLIYNHSLPSKMSAQNPTQP